jgi:predicted RecB family nuclease
MRPPPHLSKSRYLAGLQCQRRLWLGWYDPEPTADPAPGSILAVGHEVGEHAHELFPGGVLVEEGPRNFAEALVRTQTLLADPEIHTIFEPAFVFDDVWVRVDVLERVEGGGWALSEVKSSTRVKPENIHDVAIQTYVLEGCGLDVVSANLIHVDTRYVRGFDGIDWSRFFCSTDVTDLVRAVLAEAPARVAEMHAVLTRDNAPDRRPSPHCFAPFACEFWDRCTANKPPDWIWHLPRLRADRMAALEDIGIEAIGSIPNDFRLNRAQRRVVEAYRRGGFVVQPALGEVLNQTAGPCAYMDFETFSPAIPQYVGTRPYQRIAAQWSLHIDGEDGALEHQEFLADLAFDPRRSFAETLLDAVGGNGPIVVYSSFESSVLNDLAKQFPDLAAPLQAVRARLVDLLPVVRGHVDHPDFKGSNSIKDIAPVLAPDLRYEDLPDVAEGGEAAAALYRLATMHLQAGETVESVREGLLRYCALDTLALAKVRGALAELDDQAPHV